jgi:tetratricopeptide (TPR) repeat protein
MKALEKDRARRYDTANGLAMDILRHLNCEPVLARPPSRLYEFQKTVRRHSFGFGAAFAVAAALVIGLGLSTWSFYKEKSAHRQAVEAREQAYANFQIARDTVDRMLTRVATDLAGEPRMVQLRRTLLEDALQFYQQFVEQKGDDPALRYDLARAYIRVGDIYSWLGEYKKVLAPCEQALVMLDELGRQHPTDPRYRVDMVEAYSLLHAKAWLGQIVELIAHARSKVRVTEDLRRDFPTVPAYLYLAASAHEDLGNILGDVAPKESLAELRQALKLYENHRTRFPSVPEDRVRLAHIHHWLGSALRANGRYPEAEREYRQSMELRTQLIREEPPSLYLQDQLAHVKDYLAGLLARTGRGAEAEELLQEAVAINEQGLTDQLRHAESARRAGIVRRDLGDPLLAMHRTVEAEKNLRRAIELHGELAQDLVDVPEYRWSLAEDQYELAVLLEATGRSGEAAEAFRKAIELLEQVIVENPQSPNWPRRLGWMLATCPVVQFRNPPRALALVQQAIQLAPERGDTWGLLGIAQYRAGQPAAAIGSLRKALELTDGGEPEQWFFLALAYWQDQDHQQAWEWYNKAIAWIEKNHPTGEALDRFRAEAGAVLRP